MSHPDPLFDPENVLPEDIDGDEADRLFQEEKDERAASILNTVVELVKRGIQAKEDAGFIVNKAIVDEVLLEVKMKLNDEN